MQLERNRSWNFAAVVEDDLDRFTVSVGLCHYSGEALKNITVFKLHDISMSPDLPMYLRAVPLVSCRRDV